MDWDFVDERSVEDMISSAVGAIMNGETVVIAEVDPEADDTQELFTVRRARGEDDDADEAYAFTDSYEARERVRRLIGQALGVNAELWAIANYCNENKVWLEASLED